jgi:ferredoxin
MALKYEPSKCTMCGGCELGCGYRWDVALSPVTSSIMIYRAREKKNYFGVMIKEDENLILGRPEGVQPQRIGAVNPDEEADAAAKPIMLRQACDLCGGADTMRCVQFCPTGALYKA